MNRQIYLRAFEPEDYKTIVNWRNDREIAQKLGGGVFLTFLPNAKRNGYSIQFTDTVM